MTCWWACRPTDTPAYKGHDISTWSLSAASCLNRVDGDVEEDDSAARQQADATRYQQDHRFRLVAVVLAFGGGSRLSPAESLF